MISNEERREARVPREARRGAVGDARREREGVEARQRRGQRDLRGRVPDLGTCCGGTRGGGTCCGGTDRPVSQGGGDRPRPGRVVGA